ncbi:hypothetical protein AB0C60_34390, partial [Streptomyces sp. NPDC048845]
GTAQDYRGINYVLAALVVETRPGLRPRVRPVPPGARVAGPSAVRRERVAYRRFPGRAGCGDRLRAG